MGNLHMTIAVYHDMQAGKLISRVSFVALHNLKSVVTHSFLPPGLCASMTGNRHHTQTLCAALLPPLIPTPQRQPAHHMSIPAVRLSSIPIRWVAICWCRSCNRLAAFLWRWIGLHCWFRFVGWGVPPFPLLLQDTAYLPYGYQDGEANENGYYNMLYHRTSYAFSGSQFLPP